MSEDTTTWMGLTLTHEYIRTLRAAGLNPWLTALSGQPIPARPEAQEPTT